MDCSTPGFPVYHQLPELVQTVSEAIKPSHPLLSPSPPESISPSIRVKIESSIGLVPLVLFFFSPWVILFFEAIVLQNIGWTIEVWLVLLVVLPYFFPPYFLTLDTFLIHASNLDSSWLLLYASLSLVFSSVTQLCSTLATSWTAAHQATLFITNSQILVKLMSIKSVMPLNHVILCGPLLLLPSIFPTIRVFSNESALHIR